MIVLLPEGRAVCNAESVKLVKVVPSEVQGVKTYLVLVKLDDDSELMIKTVTSEEDAFQLADDCIEALNAGESMDDDDSDADSDADSDDADSDDDSDGGDDDWDDDDDSDW